MYRWNVASLTPMALAIASSGSGFGADKVDCAGDTLSVVTVGSVVSGFSL